MVTARLALVATVAVLVSAPTAAAVLAQTPTPRPFPAPGATAKPEPPQVPTPTAPSVASEPSEATLGLPVYPTADFVGSFDAGFGQRYYLFGTNAPYADIVDYYKVILRKRGDQIFDEPPVHVFEVGRFRDDTMAYPPGVTVKDYTWRGSEGYLAVEGPTGTRYRTIIQIVPAPPDS
jgi:hypothetical protein